MDRVYITIINPRGWDRLGFIIVTQLRSTVQPLTSTIDDEKERGLIKFIPHMWWGRDPTLILGEPRSTVIIT